MLVLKADLLHDKVIREIFDDPSAHIESKDFFSWERFFTALLTERSRDTWLRYSKRSLNPNYTQPSVMERIGKILPAALQAMPNHTIEE